MKEQRKFWSEEILIAQILCYFVVIGAGTLAVALAVH